jgi:hypothetical protein
MTRFSKTGRFQYARGFKTYSAAEQALWDMIAQDEISPHEGTIEPYTVDNGGQRLRRFAVTTPGH